MPDSTPTELESQLYRPFSWLGKEAESPEATFAAMTHDLARGISLAADIVHNSDLQESNGEAPLFTARDRERLLRLVVVSATLLEDAAWSRLEIANQTASQKGGAR